MPRLHDTEVAAVQGRQLGLAQPLDDSEDGRVHEADVEVGVLLHNLLHSGVVAWVQTLNLVRTGLNIPQEGRKYAAIPLGSQPIEFN
jgi:hypothetical protein